MPIRMTTPQSQIADYFEQQIQRLEKAIVRNLCYVGEQVVNEARSNHTYRVQTGNLASSVGYAVSIDGQLAKVSAFQKVKNGTEGVKDGQQYVREVIGRYPKGIVLVVVAGMNYAEYVSDKGYNVLDSAELLAEVLVPRMLKQLGLK